MHTSFLPSALENSKKRPRDGEMSISDYDSESESENEKRASAPKELERNTTLTPNSDKSRNKIKQNADKLIQVIISGQEKLETRLQKEGETNYDLTVFKLKIPKNGEDYNLEQIENTLLELEASCTDKRKKWTLWYFLSCIQMVKEEIWETRRETTEKHRGRKHKPYLSAKIINLIINKLIETDNMAAMGVYNAFTGKKRYC